MPKVTVSCSACGNRLSRFPSVVSRSVEQFCSRRCRYDDERRAAHFWSQVDKTGDCWPHQGKSFTQRGHIRLNFDGETTLVHRVAYVLAIGPIPSGMHCLHTCDNPPCCNPAHLFLGTNADNVADKVAKGRQARGERMAWGKLTEGDVRELRRLRELDPKTWTFRALGRHFGVMSSHAVHIVQRKMWKHVA